MSHFEVLSRATVNVKFAVAFCDGILTPFVGGNESESFEMPS